MTPGDLVLLLLMCAIVWYCVAAALPGRPQLPAPAVIAWPPEPQEPAAAAPVQQVTPDAPAPVDPLGALFTPPTRACGPWHAMPGDRLELLDTGFAIELHPLYRNAYWLFSPEGYRLVAWHDLEEVKRHGELHAAQRASFSVAPLDVRQLGRRGEQA